MTPTFAPAPPPSTVSVSCSRRRGTASCDWNSPLISRSRTNDNCTARVPVAVPTSSSSPSALGRARLGLAQRNGEQLAFDAFLLLVDDDHVLADVRARDLAQVECLLLLGDLVASGLRADELAAAGRVGPERAQYRHGQLLEHDAALGLGRQGGLAHEVGVPVLEDRRFHDRQRRGNALRGILARREVAGDGTTGHEQRNESQCRGLHGR
jgi:hypothetical protein